MALEAEPHGYIHILNTLRAGVLIYSYLDFGLKSAIFGCLTNATAPPPITLESCWMAQTDQPVF